MSTIDPREGAPNRPAMTYRPDRIGAPHAPVAGRVQAGEDSGSAAPGGSPPPVDGTTARGAPVAARGSGDDAARRRFALGPPLMPYRGRPAAPAESERGGPQPPDEVPYPHPERRLVVLGPKRGVPPTRIPRVPRVELAVRYEPAIAQTAVCGDFYEVIPVGRRVLIGIGDVVGHSAHAATVTADLLPVLRALVHQGNDLRATLRRLNDVMLRYWPDHTATVCLMLLDPVTGVLEVANAGHPPPLVSAGGPPRYLRHGGVLLGVAGEEARVERLAPPAGGVAVLFTDGLVERRGVPIDDGLERLRTLCARADGDLEGLCDRILGAFGAREDDVALVALRRS